MAPWQKYIFGGKEEQVVTDVAIVNHLKTKYFVELIMIPGTMIRIMNGQLKQLSVEYQKWDTDSCAHNLIAFMGHNLSRNMLCSRLVKDATVDSLRPFVLVDIPILLWPLATTSYETICGTVVH